MSAPTSQLPEGVPVDPDLVPGQRVGEYVVDGKLGQGAFGTVFRATHPVIGKQVAIKVLARKFSVDPDMVSRFAAEARAVNQIRHRNIIDIFSFERLDDGRHYYAMEYLEGETLDARLDRHGRLSLPEAIPILRGIARALDAAHAKGIAHRDLKAENVFLASDPDGGVWPKLLDFGIAKLLAPDDGATSGLKHKTRTGTPVGTPYYMSPEQCRGRDVDHRTDFYAFGVLAYRLLTGRYPFDADDYMGILMQQLTQDAVPASTIVGELPAGIDEALAWLMQKDPARRPPSLRVAVAALETAAEHAGIELATAAWDPVTGPQSRVEPAKAPSVNIANAPTVAPPFRANSGAIATPAAETAALAVAPPAKRRAGIAIAAIGVVALAAAIVIVPRWLATRDATSSPVTTPTKPAPAPAPPAPPPIEPPPTEPPPIEAQTVIVTVTGVPDGTEVIAGGMTAGAAPGPVQLPRDHASLVLTFKREGYLPTSRTVTPDRDQALSVTLKRRPTIKQPNKDDLIDYFKP
ncbi:MAG TPA: protein kinase [Kofleriaceae bacterium]|nr:protein kinase [Kofleriaceae bacterium]